MKKYIYNIDISTKILLFYQPIVYSNNFNDVYKYEALVRLKGENHEIHCPDEFLPIIKEYDLYDFLNIIVLEKALQKLLSEPNINISVNICFSHLVKKEIQSKIKNLLLAAGVNVCSRLTFELLETYNVKDYLVLKNFISAIRLQGCKIAIDDFGTGFSNYSHLLNIEFDYLKIAGELIKEIKNNQKNLDILESIILFCNNQNIKIIAEYVETEEIALTLHHMGVEFLQGYYFSKPQEHTNYEKVYNG
ncbi:MAG: hypothetical protein A3F91_09860 [Flavobacteria bacterium RIFCSPLOWO2_12_FULL_35_11]|nr:MAG: hypothetical protein A3F91_09860 [Flavobacteria bacterium RIFCSPLOWO2_12_FULL_35_11]